MKKLIDILKLIGIIILAFIMHVIVWWPYLCIIFILLFILAKIHYLLMLIFSILRVEVGPTGEPVVDRVEGTNKGYLVKPC